MSLDFQKLELDLDEKSRDFIATIIAEMIRLFDIAEDEAVARIHNRWRGQTFRYPDIIFHELPEYWAKEIYYGHDADWWISEDGLEPEPLPAADD